MPLLLLKRHIAMIGPSQLVSVLARAGSGLSRSWSSSSVSRGSFFLARFAVTELYPISE